MNGPDISTKLIHMFRFIYRSIFASYEMHAMNYFASLGMYASGMLDAEVTKLLYKGQINTCMILFGSLDIRAMIICMY